MSLIRVHIETSVPYDVVVGSGALEEAPKFVATSAAGGDGRVAVISDRTVAPLHAARLASLADAPRFELEPGEGSKSFARLEEVLDFLAASKLNRNSTLVALGGGVVGDLAGLAASLFMRGIAVVHCPTTLLAQADSSIGGKTAVNLAAGKNLAGTFHQPRAVLSDTETLATLPDVELRSGLGEVVKTAWVGDASLVTLLEETAPRILARDAEVLGEVVARCARVKGAIVAADEREAGERAKLNLGHTFGHAIELVAGFGRIPHGEAVAVGLVLAVEASRRVGVLDPGEPGSRLGELLARLELPRSLDDLRTRHGVALSSDELVTGMRLDKKGAAGVTRFVLPETIGRLRIEQTVDRATLAEVCA